MSNDKLSKKKPIQSECTCSLSLEIQTSTTQMKKNRFLKILLFATILLSNALFADGSKDFYPSGAFGLPAYLQSSTESTVN